MKIYSGLSDLGKYRGGVLSIGNFDGVHRGHQSMLQTLVEKSKHHGVPSIVLTFDPSPIEILKPLLTPPRLTTMERKLELIELLGVDCLVVFPADRSFLALSPEQFFKQIIQEKIHAQCLVEGKNFFFGKNRTGDIELLSQFCTDAGIELTIADSVFFEEKLISSSRIRAAIAAGELKFAGELLGVPYQVVGGVVPGVSRGREIGFPTANLEGVNTLLPKEGVYAGRAIVNGVGYPAAINVGGNPTFEEHESKMEIHLIGFSGDLYGEFLKVDFFKRLRDVLPFASSEELQAQLTCDVQESEREFQALHSIEVRNAD